MRAKATTELSLGLNPCGVIPKASTLRVPVGRLFARNDKRFRGCRLHAPFSPRLATTLELLFQKPTGIPLCGILDLSGSDQRVSRAPSAEPSPRKRAPLDPRQMRLSL